MAKLLNVKGQTIKIDGEPVNALWLQRTEGGAQAYFYLEDGTAEGRRVEVHPSQLIYEINGEISCLAFTTPEGLSAARLKLFKERLSVALEDGRNLRVMLGLGDIAAILSALENGPAEVGELLAVMHGDGGHYQAQHGTAKAAADAKGIFYRALGADVDPAPGEAF